VHQGDKRRDRSHQVGDDAREAEAQAPDDPLEDDHAAQRDVGQRAAQDGRGACARRGPNLQEPERKRRDQQAEVHQKERDREAVARARLAAFRTAQDDQAREQREADREGGACVVGEVDELEKHPVRRTRAAIRSG
jgi:hypothetical protein